MHCPCTTAGGRVRGYPQTLCCTARSFPGSLSKNCLKKLLRSGFCWHWKEQAHVFRVIFILYDAGARVSFAEDTVEPIDSQICHASSGAEVLQSAVLTPRDKDKQGISASFGKAL